MNVTRLALYNNTYVMYTTHAHEPMDYLSIRIPPLFLSFGSLIQVGSKVLAMIYEVLELSFPISFQDHIT